MDELVAARPTRRRSSVLIVVDEVDVDLALLLFYEASLFHVGRKLLRRRHPLLEEDSIDVDVDVPLTVLLCLLRAERA